MNSALGGLRATKPTDGSGELNCAIGVGCRWTEVPAGGCATKSSCGGWHEAKNQAISPSGRGSLFDLDQGAERLLGAGGRR